MFRKAYRLPLRLLAREVYARVVERAVSCVAVLTTVTCALAIGAPSNLTDPSKVIVFCA